jgi:hypothetical protein
LSGAIACELSKPRFIQLRSTQAVSIKPAIQVSKKPEFIPGVDSAVAQLEKKLSKLVDVASQWATSETLDRARMFEEPCRHTSFTSGTHPLDAADYPD